MGPVTTTQTIAPLTTTQTFPTSSPVTTSPGSSCLVVKSPCNDVSLNQTRLDTNGYYCQPFSNGMDFSFRFSCSLTLPNSIDVFACAANCASGCVLDPVTKNVLGLDQYNGQLGGTGQCFSLPGMDFPGQISCETCPVSTTAPVTTTTTALVTTAAPTTMPAGFCLNLTSPCNGSPVQNYDDGSQYCLLQDGPPNAPKVAISLICSSDGNSITTATCTSPTCESGCVFNPVWAFILGLDRVNASGAGECLSNSSSPVPGVPSPARFQCTPGPCVGRTTTAIAPTTTVSISTTVPPVTTTPTFVPSTTERTTIAPTTTIALTTTVPYLILLFYFFFVLIIFV